MKKTVLVFSLLILALLLLFQFSKYTFISGNSQMEYIMALVVIIFLDVGLFINKKTQKQNSASNTEIDFQKNLKFSIAIVIAVKLRILNKRFIFLILQLKH